MKSSKENVPFPFAEYMKLGEVKKLVYRFGDELQKRNGRSIAVTSLEPGEGKTFLTAILAFGSAFFLKKKVLIIDTSSQPNQGNLYLDRIFGDDSAGKHVDLIKPDTIPGVRSDAADFELKGLLEHYLKEYDLVIFDTMAINESNQDSMDPIIVSKTSGAAVMVMSKKSISSGDLRKIRSEFNEWGIPLLGSVYNFWSSK